jgi:hypothetical protein
MLRKMFSVVALATIALPLISHTPAMATTVYAGPANTGGCYRIGDEQIKFAAIQVTTNIDSELKALVNSASAKCDGTHIASSSLTQNSWTLPDDRPKFLLLYWKNLTTRQYGYTFVQNTPDAWWSKTNSKGWRTIPNGTSSIENWFVNGFPVSISVQNPIDVNGWTPNDVLYSFYNR